ncbi:hypothetical protein BDZ85DRAFT_313093 [Elsinoe ampelina]|uniref:Uncharacterized protein n=1 Tax=Elsinoe ampelina TaxID=302913 RepID=A0A6A6G9M3_9PEZI|nr:hypothetical protein BDZ85DRAFT_313093 [Elsinoe ampelina]
MRAGEAALATTPTAATTSDATPMSCFSADGLSPLSAMSPPTMDASLNSIPDHAVDPRLLFCDHTLNQSSQPYVVDEESWQWFDMDFTGDPLADPISA